MISLEDILAKKAARDKDKDKPLEINIPSLGCTVEFIRPKQSDILKTLSKVNEIEGDYEENDLLESTFIYNHFPYSKQLAADKEYMLNNGINSEIDVVRTLFTIADRKLIINELMKAGGFVNLDETIKN